MKALIREKGETVTEDMGIPGIDWATGYPLTARRWAGGPYVLVNDYVRKDPADDFVPADDDATYGCTNPSAASQPADLTPAVAPEASQDPAADLQDTIVIDGVTYIRKSQD